jgi:predicted nucleic acid-binding protein
VAILVDTGPIYALADKDDQHHEAVRRFVASAAEALVVPGPVVPEACYLLASHLGPEAEVQFLRAFAGREMLLEQPTAKDLERVIEILIQYREAGFGMVDATVMAMAERLKIEVVLTLDHRHFQIYRPRHCRAFHLVPNLSRSRGR